MWWGHGFDGFGWGWMIFGGLMMLVFWGGLIALIVLAVRAFANPGSQEPAQARTSSASSRNDALSILKERYARGEITKAEYEEMLEDLRR